MVLESVRYGGHPKLADPLAKGLLVVMAGLERGTCMRKGE
jgi:hypothetical protein